MMSLIPLGHLFDSEEYERTQKERVLCFMRASIFKESAIMITGFPHALQSTKVWCQIC